MTIRSVREWSQAAERCWREGVAATAISGFPFISRGYAAQTLKFWQFYGPGGGVASQDKWYQDVVKGWNDSHDVKVELVYVPNNAYMDGTKLPTAFASGAGPDLFIISPGDFLRYYNGGVLLDLTPFMEQAAQDDFFPNVIASRKVNGKIYALPQEVEPMAMYYSVDAFNEVGLTDKDVPKTWEELLSVAKKLTTAKRYGVLFETSPGYYQNFTWYPFLWEGGGDFQTADGKSAFNSPGAIQALKFWQDAINTGVAPRKPMGGGGWDVVPNLGSGYCAMQNVGIWAISQLREGKPDFKSAYSSSHASRWQVHHHRRRLGLRGQCAGLQIQRPRASSSPGRSDRRRTARRPVWSTGAPRPRATCRRPNPRWKRGRRRSRAASSRSSPTRSIRGRGASRGCLRRCTRRSRTRSRHAS